MSEGIALDILAEALNAKGAFINGDNISTRVVHTGVLSVCVKGTGEDVYDKRDHENVDVLRYGEESTARGTDPMFYTFDEEDWQEEVAENCEVSSERDAIESGGCATSSPRFSL